MGLDIRFPLGLIFLLLGIIMVGYGAATHGSSIYQMSGGININVVWGSVMLIFGGGMMIAARRAR